MFQKRYKNFETKKVKSNDSSFSINSYFSQPCLDHSRGDNFTHPVLIPALIPILDQLIVLRLVTRLGHSTRDIHHSKLSHYFQFTLITLFYHLPFTTIQQERMYTDEKNISLSFDADVLVYPVWQ